MCCCFVEFSAICLQTIPKPWEEYNGFYAAAVWLLLSLSLSAAQHSWGSAVSNWAKCVQGQRLLSNTICQAISREVQQIWNCTYAEFAETRLTPILDPVQEPWILFLILIQITTKLPSFRFTAATEAALRSPVTKEPCLHFHWFFVLHADDADFNYLTTCCLPRLDFCCKRAYAIAIPSVCLSVCPSVTRVDQSKTAEGRIMQFSLYSSPISLVFAR